MKNEKERNETFLPPIFTARFDNPDDTELLKNAIGAEALDKAFDNEEPLAKLTKNLLIAGVLQRHRQETEKYRAVEADIAEMFEQIGNRAKPAEPPKNESLCPDWKDFGRQKDLF